MHRLANIFLSRRRPGGSEAMHWYLLVRLTVLFVALGVVFSARAMGAWSVELTFSALVVLAASFGLTLVVSLFVDKLSSGFAPSASQIALDALMTGAWLYSLKSSGESIALFFVVQILSSALIFGKRGAWFSSIASSLAYLVAASASVGWLSGVVYTTLFWMVGVCGGYLAEELTRTTRRLERSEQTIRQLTELHERILSDLPTGLVTVDNDFRINFVNPAASAILNLSDAQLVGQIFDEVLPELSPFFSTIQSERLEDSPGGLEAAAHGIGSHRSVFVHSKNDRIRLGQRVEFRRGSRVLRGDVTDLGNAIAGSGLLRANVKEGKILLFQDVTLVDHLEERLRQNEKLAAVGQLAAGIAHEIRNPLASMSASIEMLRESYRPSKSDENHKLMDITIREIDRLNSLVTEFLEYVKPEQIKLIREDMTQLVEEVSGAIRLRKDLPLGAEVIVINEGPVFVQCHREKLKGVLINLAINALQAIGPGGFIKFGVVKEGSSVRLWCEDNGSGMTEKVKGHLFEPFFTTKSKGTGLGLAITYKVIELHLGTIEVKSEVGKGARFDILIPGVA